MPEHASNKAPLHVVNSDPCILLVEDSVADTALIEMRLRSIWPNVKVVMATTLADAYEVYLEEKLDLILLDLNLPDGFGPRSVEEALSFVRNVPVVVLTGMGTNLTISEAKKMGAIEVLTKSKLMDDTFVTTVKNSIKQ